MKIYKTLVMGVIVMLLCLPVSFAVTLTGFGYGEDEKRDFVRETDKVTLQAEVGGYNVEDGELKYTPNVGTPVEFEDCSDDVCTLQLEERTFDAKSYTYPIEFDYTGGEATEQITIYPDVLGAKVNSVSANKNYVSSSHTVTFSFNLEDDSCETASCSGKCSGIKEIRVKKDGSEVTTFGVHEESCNVNFEKTVNVEDLSPDEGTNTYVFEAVDNFENPPRDRKTVTLEVDDTAPSVADESFNLVKNGKNVSFYNEPIPNAKLSFNLNDDAEKVKVDLSQLGGQRKNIDCQNGYCSTTLDIDLGDVSDGEDKDIEVPVELEDSLGNSEAYTLSKEITIDTSGPVVEEVSTQYDKVEEALGFGKDTNLEVFLEDEGIGFDEGDIFVDFSPIGGGSRVKAMNCTSEKCTFPEVSVTSEGVNTLNVLASSKDNIGNEMGSPHSFDVYSDKTPPEVKDIPVVEFEAEHSTENRTYPVKGDTLKIKAIVEEPRELTAYGNFSAINPEGIFEADCSGSSSSRGSFSSDSGSSGDSGGNIDRSSGSSSRSSSDQEEEEEIILSENEQLCEWEVEVTRSGSIIGKEPEVYFEDMFGNQEKESVPIPNVYGLDGELDPNYWKTDFKCSPKNLDRMAGELVKQQMYCSFKLTPLSEREQQIQNIEMVGCENDKGFLDEATLHNKFSEYPYLSLTFDKDKYETNGFDMNCSLAISSVVGDEVITETEEENLQIPVNFFNHPFDMPDDSIVNKIENIKETYADGTLWQIIKWLGVIESIASDICSLTNSWQQLSQSLSGVAAGVPDPKGKPLRDAAEGNDQASWFSRQGFQRFCDFINCRMSEGQKGNWENSFSGRADYVGDIKNTLGEVGGGGMIESMTGEKVSKYQDVKNNVYLSFITLCIPGIVHNLEKYRQIQCFYGYCLQDMTVMSGIPPRVCEKQKSYMECKYFSTPLFTLFPLVNMVNSWLTTIQNALRDPFSAIGTVANLVCPTTDQGSWTACRLVHVINSALDAWQDVENIISDFKGLSEDYCDDLESSPRSRSSGSRGDGTISRGR